MNYKKSVLSIFYLMILTLFSFSANIVIQGLKGTDIFINDVYNTTIQSEQTIIEIPEGNYNIKLKKSGFTDYEKNIQLQQNSYENLIAQQIPLTRIEFNLNIPQFTVEYEYQQTKINYELKNKDYIDIPYTVKSIKVMANEYNTLEVNLNSKPFLKTTITDELLKMGYIKINTAPEKSKVYYKNEYIGETPIIIEKEKIEDIYIEKEGYIREKIENYSNQGEMTINLNKGINLSIGSNPIETAVYIDGEYKGNTPYSSMLKKGKYTITLSKFGYKTKQMYINLEKEEDYNSYYITLESMFNEINIINAKEYEINIDGVYFGNGINKIYIDDSKHSFRALNKDKNINTVIDKNIKMIDLKRTSFINVVGSENEYINMLNKSLKSPSFFNLNLISNEQPVSIKTISNNYIVNAKPGESSDLFTKEDKAMLIISSNNPNTSFYINGDYVNAQDAINKIVNPGTYNIKANFANMSEIINVDIKDNEIKYINFNFKYDIPVKIKSDTGIKVNDKNYTNIPELFYLNMGANKIEYKNEKIIIFIYEPQYIDLTSLN
ncbi:PEGA domain-containing protein [Oceanotoga sp. DSM 15011]|uniref:PEGA domain-containing protein n=1 Tax=Oceanotoga sp. DSM 15011 TaxID=2984951 RepID=UPI0021F41B8E|nr:PEGA domain-containing protein [Oceanotoga sp. DSM 15011]UYP00057.1 PEGA domain-containing protein [Oceanotoga sp. DSM 15011]